MEHAAVMTMDAAITPSSAEVGFLRGVKKKSTSGACLNIRSSPFMKRRRTAPYPETAPISRSGPIFQNGRSALLTLSWSDPASALRTRARRSRTC